MKKKKMMMMMMMMMLVTTMGVGGKAQRLPRDLAGGLCPAARAFLVNEAPKAPRPPRALHDGREVDDEADGGVGPDEDGAVDVARIADGGVDDAVDEVVDDGNEAGGDTRIIVNERASSTAAALTSGTSTAPSSSAPTPSCARSSTDGTMCHNTSC